MNPSFSFGRIGGVPVGAHWSALLGVAALAVLLGSTVLPGLAPGAAPLAYGVAGGVAAVVMAVSLLAHELAHAVVARRSGLEVRRITLWLLGGVSELGAQPAQAGVELRMALAGPVVSLALGVGLAGTGWVMAVSAAPALATATVFWLAMVNLVLGVFNLLPGSPLDGGRVLHGLVWLRSGDRRRATRTATGAGQFLGVVLGSVGLVMALGGRWDGLWLLAVGWFVTGAAAGERAYESVVEELDGLTAADAMTRAPRVAPGWWTVRAFADDLDADRRRDGSLPRHRVYPVVDLQGSPTGVVGLEDLVRVPVAERPSTAVRTVTRPVRPEQVVAAGEPLTRLVARLTAAPLLLVVTDGRLVGVLTAGDLMTTAALRALGPGPATLPSGPVTGTP